MTPQRAMLLVAHTGRAERCHTARTWPVERLTAAGVAVRVLNAEADDLRLPGSR